MPLGLDLSLTSELYMILVKNPLEILFGFGMISGQLDYLNVILSVLQCSSHSS